jgi:hypothetical protein
MKTETKLDLSFAIGIGICIIVITAALLWALPADAQTTWVRCKLVSDPTQKQSFPDRCPTGWVRG